MLLRRAELEAIRAGEADLAFRRWKRPRVRVGTRMRTAVGLVEVTSLEVVDPSAIGSGEARRAGFGAVADVTELLARRPEGRVYRVGLRYAGPDPRVARRADADLSGGPAEALDERLDRLDVASRHGPWTRAVLAAIEAEPGRRAPDLAAAQGRDTAPVKRDVRKLKELGLTESLEVGYRLSPRGEAYLAHARGASPRNS